MMRIQGSMVLYIALLACLFVTGMLTRRFVFDAQQKQADYELPFTLESALHFRLVHMVYEGVGISFHDDYVQAPEGLRPFETYSIGAEYVYAWMARLLPKEWSLTTRVRWTALFWFCLAIPLMALWIHGLTDSRTAGLLAAAFYAFTLASVVRSTGQELSRENFALPLLLAHLACAAWATRFQTGWPAVLLHAGAAIFLGSAAVFWDMIQFVLYLWLLTACVKFVRGADHWRKAFLAGWSGVVLAYVLHPYARAHGALLSPFVLLGTALVVGIVCEWLNRPRSGYKAAGICPSWLVRLAGSVSRTAWRRSGLLLSALLAAAVVGHLYAESYGHFAELTWAKLRFLNVKPVDPACLTFSQRIMWTPALNSATWGLTTAMMPILLPLSLCALAGCVWWHRRNGCRTGLLSLPVCFLISLVAYILFVRFHVFVAFFGAALLGCAAGYAMKGKASTRVTWVLLVLLVGGVLDFSHTLKNANAWGRPNIYYEDLNELTDFLAAEIAPATVLANFGVSASILAYGGCPVILHPKFETDMIRSRVEEYGKHLFRADEQAFRAWADAHGAQFYVHSLGEFSTVMPELQMRYFVDALEPPPEAAARLFEYDPEASRYFQLVWHNRKYRVFRVLSHIEEQRAARLARQAFEALYSGDWMEAEAFASDALRLDPGSEQGVRVLRHVESLRAQGVIRNGID